MEERNRRPGKGDGSGFLGGEVYRAHNTPREILKASPLARARLAAILWAGWLQGGARP